MEPGRCAVKSPLQSKLILLSVVITTHNLHQWKKKNQHVFSKEAVRSPRRMNIASGEYNETKYSIYMCIDFLL